MCVTRYFVLFFSLFIFVVITGPSGLLWLFGKISTGRGSALIFSVMAVVLCSVLCLVFVLLHWGYITREQGKGEITLLVFACLFLLEILAGAAKNI